MNRPQLAGLAVKIEVLKGRNLIAKGCSLIMGKRTTSDSPVREKSRCNHLIGKTKVIKKKVKPRLGLTISIYHGGRLSSSDHATAVSKSSAVGYLDNFRL
jgi:hypothetical protein